MDLQEQIKSYLLENGFAPGDKIPPETVLAEIFHTSRNKIREVTTTLCHQGILEKKARRGTILLEPDPDRVRGEFLFQFNLTRQNHFDCVEARKVLEKAVIPLTVRRIVPQQLQKLNEIMQAMETPGITPECLDELDCQFHLLLLESCGNKTLQTFGQVIQGLFQHDFRVIYRTEAMMQKAISAHRKLYEAIKHSDTALAVECLEHHFNSPEDFK
jgi:DNA-binding FadR family transcriptional regulator